MAEIEKLAVAILAVGVMGLIFLGIASFWND